MVKRSRGDMFYVLSQTANRTYPVRVDMQKLYQLDINKKS